MYKAIVFDFYGTLIDINKSSKDIINKMVNTFKDKFKIVIKKMDEYHRIHIENLNEFILEKKIFVMDFKKIYEEFNIDRDAEKDMKLLFSDFGIRDPFDDTIKVVNKLRKKYKVFIASNSDNDYFMKDFEQSGINVDGFYTSEILKAYKPNEDFFTKLLNKINYNNDDVVYIGDSFHYDVLGPLNSGIDAVWINRNNKKNEMKLEKSFKTIYSLIELMEIL